MSKCCCHVSGYAVKDAEARRRITVIEEELDEGYIKPSGTLPITEPGEYDVKEYEKVDVQIEPSSEPSEPSTPSIPDGYVIPTGTKVIGKVKNTDGSTTHNVSGYEKVNIQLPETPLVIDDLVLNGQLIDVSNYKYVYLNIATFDGSGSV